MQRHLLGSSVEPLRFHSITNLPHVMLSGTHSSFQMYSRVHLWSSDSIWTPPQGPHQALLLWYSWASLLRFRTLPYSGWHQRSWMLVSHSSADVDLHVKSQRTYSWGIYTKHRQFQPENWEGCCCRQWWGLFLVNIFYFKLWK